MSRRESPYLPLYVQDFLTDEKLAECSAESTGVYIRLMCLLHKSETYGSILLKQKYKQNESKIENFASQVSRQMPYEYDVVLRSLGELVEEGVISIDGDVLSQKRMVYDGKLSETRASAGKKGGRKGGKGSSASGASDAFASDFAKAKSEANAEIEIEDEEEKEYTEGRLKEEIGKGGTVIPARKETHGFDGETHASDSLCDPALSEVMSFYMDRINPQPSPLALTEIQDFLEDLEADVLIHAMQIAVDENKRTWSYIKAILRRYRNSGLRTLPLVMASEQAHEAQKGRQQPRGASQPARSSVDLLAQMVEEGL